MNNTLLERVLALAQKTGDRLIVIPQDGDPFVVMPLAIYEQMTTVPSVATGEWITGGEVAEPVEAAAQDHVYIEPVAQ